MKVDPFLVEQYLNVYEQKVEVNLAETSVVPFSLKEFLALTGHEDFFQQLEEIQLDYGHIEGSPAFREGLAALYRHVNPEDVLATGGAIGANFLVFYSLVEPGDTVITVFPAYQQLYSVARSLGANVKLLRLRRDNRWLPDVNELRELVDGKTKLIVINSPHNPTGSLIDDGILRELCSITEDAKAYLLCDESYRGLYINPEDTVSSAVDLSQRAIVTGSFSKSLSLTGLRLGWIAARGEIVRECLSHRDYTTISNGILDEALASLALKHVNRIFERNLNIIRTNHRILSQWVEDMPQIDWIPPQAGTTAFLEYKMKVPSLELCLRLMNEKGLLLVPASCFEMEGFLRMSFACKAETLKTGLDRFTDFLNTSWR